MAGFPLLASLTSLGAAKFASFPAVHLCLGQALLLGGINNAEAQKFLLPI